MRSWKLACLVAAVVLPSLSSVGSATPVLYTNSSSFIADNSAVLLEDFEAVFPKDAPLLSFTSNGVTYTGVQATSPNVWVASPGYTNFGVPITTSSVLTSNGNEEFTVDLGANASNAVGFDLYHNGLGPLTIEYYGSGGDTINIHTDLSSTGGMFFLGLVLDEPIYSFKWTAIGGQTINTGIDNLYVGTIPAPGAILLGTIGAGLVGWLRRRRAV